MILPVGVWAPKVTAAVATILAGALARRRSELRPLAVWFAAMLAFDVVRLGLHLRFSLDHPIGAPPFEGAARAAWMLDTALYLTWPASLAALCLYYFGERRPWLAGVAWLATSGAVARTYPDVRGEALRRVFLACELIALFVSALSAVHAWRARRQVNEAHEALAIVLATEALTFAAGAWRFGLFARYDLTQLAYLLMYAAIATLFGGALWMQDRGK